MKVPSHYREPLVPPSEVEEFVQETVIPRWVKYGGMPTTGTMATRAITIMTASGRTTPRTQASAPTAAATARRQLPRRPTRTASVARHAGMRMA